MPPVTDAIGVFVLLATALGQMTFVALYLSFPWWRSTLGRVLFLKALALSTVLTVGIAAQLWNWPYEDGTLRLLYGVLALGIWAQVAVFIRLLCQGKGRDQNREGDAR